MKVKKLHKLKKMQAHVVAKYEQGYYVGQDKVTEICFPKIWNKRLIRSWLNKNGYEEYYDRSVGWIDSNYHFATEIKIRKNKVKVIEYYNV